jgi:LSD1 subclass zinc finger protein
MQCEESVIGKFLVGTTVFEYLAASSVHCAICLTFHMFQFTQRNGCLARS